MSEELFRRHIMYEKDFELDGDKFTFLPLPEKYAPKLYGVFSHLAPLFSGEKTEAEIISGLDENTVSKLLEVEKLFVSNSYPKMSEDTVAQFVRDNMIWLVTPLVELHVGGDDKERQAAKVVAQRKG